MTVKEWLTSSQHKLEAADIKTARLDSLVLLEFVLGVDRAKILAEPDSLISSHQIQELNNLLNRRLRHEPVAYLRGFSEFYGRKFIIDKNVLVPRPESEAFIDLLKTTVLPALNNKASIKLLDVGAGSGALGITAKLEAPDSDSITVDLLEISPSAANIAKTNVVRHATAQNVFTGDLDGYDYSPYDVLLANLPYGPDEEYINLDAEHEPRMAIFGGPTGLELYKTMLQSIATGTQRPLYLLLECKLDQIDDLIALCKDYGYEIQTKDLLVLLFCNKNPA